MRITTTGTAVAKKRSGRNFSSASAIATAIEENARIGDSRERLVSANGEFNVASVAELSRAISELTTHIKKGTFELEAASVDNGGMTFDDARKARQELLLAAYNAPGLEQMAELGANIAATISSRVRREGFMRRTLLRADLQQGQVPRIRSKQNNVEAVSTIGPVAVGVQYLREKYMFPSEHHIVVNLRIEEREIQQSQGDLLEDKFFEGLEAIMVREDRTLYTLLSRAASISNDVQYYSNQLTPGVIENLRKQVSGWGIPIAGYMVPEDVQTAFLTGTGFADFFEPVTKLRMFTEGVLGSFFGHDIMTDTFRDPLLKVLKPGEIFVVGAPEYLGAYTDRGPVKSEARINSEDTPSRGWFQHELVSQTIANPRAVAVARKI